MSVFNFMETFFFISLGITFVLILLLVYHFKQRLSAIEEKSDTMFDIINNVVQEITSVKTFVVTNMSQNTVSSFIPASVYESQNNNGIFSQNQYSSQNEQDDVKSDEDSDVSDEESEGEEESDEEVESDDERIVVSDNESESNVKIVNIPTSLNEIDDVSDNHDLELDNAVESMDLVESLPELIEDPVVVHKLESSLEESVNQQEESGILSGASYGKLTTGELKKLVIAKGLATDVSKMKKNHLVQLLESGVSE
jgi:hypothetical protein